MLGLAAFTVVVASAVGRGARAGVWLALLLAVTRRAVAGVAASHDHLRFGAVFFGVTGLLVAVGAGLLWAAGRHPLRDAA